MLINEDYFSAKYFKNCGSIRHFFGQKVKFFFNQECCRKKKVPKLGNTCVALSDEREKWNNQECPWNMSTLGRARFAVMCWEGLVPRFALEWGSTKEVFCGPFLTYSSDAVLVMGQALSLEYFREEKLGSNSDGQRMV